MPRPLNYKCYVMEEEAEEWAFHAPAFKRAIRRAMNTFWVDKEIREMLRGAERYHGVIIIGTRAILSPSDSCPEPHYMARVFARRPRGDGYYLGGIHAFPAASNSPATFLEWHYKWTRKWNARTHNSMDKRIVPV